MKKKEWMILFLFLFFMFGMYFYFSVLQEKGEMVYVYNADNQVVLKVPLKEEGIYEIKGKKGLFHLEVKENRYRAINVDCPDKICEHVGWVDKDHYHFIVCLPNGLYVELHE